MRVVALDDVPEHLRNITRGLVTAGFSVSPFLVDFGDLEDDPEYPLQGVRLVFSDIHMTVGHHDPVQSAELIIKCLKKVIAPGPYVLIFWSQYPGDSEEVQRHLSERLIAQGCVPPIGYGAIGKNEVFAVTDQGGGPLNAARLRELILECVKKHETMLVSACWEDRVYSAAVKTTNRLFELTRSYENEDQVQQWSNLLAYLSAQAVGGSLAKKDVLPALDQALLPLIEDQLSILDQSVGDYALNTNSIASAIDEKGRVERPEKISASSLHTGYLVEEIPHGKNWLPSTRGMVTELSGAFVNSGHFSQCFGVERANLIQKEFATNGVVLTNEELWKIRLHVIELGAECDHVNSKISTHRYLLGLLIPKDKMDLFSGYGRNPTRKQRDKNPVYNNESIINAGMFTLINSNAEDGNEWGLLISCRCFMALAAGKIVDGKPKFRLRRALLEEVAHRYVTYARRPGVMRFAA